MFARDCFLLLLYSVFFAWICSFCVYYYRKLCVVWRGATEFQRVWHFFTSLFEYMRNNGKVHEPNPWSLLFSLMAILNYRYIDTFCNNVIKMLEAVACFIAVILYTHKHFVIHIWTLRVLCWDLYFTLQAPISKSLENSRTKQCTQHNPIKWIVQRI